MLIGYARISNAESQDTTVQITALREAGAERIFEESASGGRWDRPQLHRMLETPPGRYPYRLEIGSSKQIAEGSVANNRQGG